MSISYDQWRAQGGRFVLAYPIGDLATLLHRYGYTVGTVGDRSHFDAHPPEDHTIDSATGWPNPSPYGWVFAMDTMPPAAGLPSLAQLGAQMIADKLNGHPGMAWLKYQNWTPAGMGCRHESFEPGHQVSPSSDAGHIHQSCRTDYQYSRCVATSGYDPVARVRSGGGNIPVLVHPVESGGALAFPGRLLVARTGSGMLHGTDVSTWQARMRTRGWPITVDGWYGPASASTCRQFQQDSTAHGWPLAEDGIVGQQTWRATWQRPIS